MAFTTSQDYARKTIRTAAILTNSYVAGTTIEQARQYSQIVLLVSFTIGSLTSAELKVEFSPDNTTFYQETFEALSGGTGTLSLGEHTMAATGNYRIAIPARDNFVKISAKGTGTVTSSTITIEAVVGNN